MPTTYGTYREIAARSHSFERLAVADRWQPALVAAGGDPERLTGDRVSADYFRVLGVAPAVGRDFDGPTMRPKVARDAVRARGLAARRFGGGAGSSGLDSCSTASLTVIRVTPPGFRNALRAARRSGRRSSIAPR